MMEIRVFRSFSCNNSSSYRLVARFSNPKTAAEATAELTAFFEEHAKQMDAAMEEGDVPEEPTEAARELAAKYGFEWRDLLTWGDDMQEGDEPKVVAREGVLVVHHTYCSGFGDELRTYLTKRGARDVKEDMGEAPVVSVLFRAPHADVADELRALFDQAKGTKYMSEWKTQPPWTEYEVDDESTNTAFFYDGKTVGFTIAISADSIPSLERWLAERGVEAPSIRLCEYGDAKKFRAIASAACSACGGPLEYLDPRTSGIDSEQLACQKCGGMFEMSTILS